MDPPSKWWSLFARTKATAPKRIATSVYPFKIPLVLVAGISMDCFVMAVIILPNFCILKGKIHPWKPSYSLLLWPWWLFYPSYASWRKKITHKNLVNLCSCDLCDCFTQLLHLEGANSPMKTWLIFAFVTLVIALPNFHILKGKKSPTKAGSMFAVGLGNWQSGSRYI